MSDDEQMSIGKGLQALAGAIIFVASAYFYIQTNSNWFVMSAIIGVMIAW